ncbi:hypothetical protein HAX54_000007 [Datura stramonium]|uniref:Uncharacterized protein n=1 Tax=Datura stramonium TaxID=4076 RepID=A0ABS8RGE7_DATST|nr:hypothetical protein [Datura stramonium]
MEKGKQVFGSSSSFTNDLFGPKEPSKTSLFGSVFGPHSTGLGRDSTHSAARGSSRIQDPRNQSCGNAKYGTSDNINGSQRSRGENSNKDKNNSILYQNGTTEPCHFSSSIYYGGQDVYYPPTTSNNTLKKNGEDDDDDQNGNNSNCASRGNWWQGSLYY